MAKQIADTVWMGKFRAEDGFTENKYFASRSLPKLQRYGGAFRHSVAIWYGRRR